VVAGTVGGGKVELSGKTGSKTGGEDSETAGTGTVVDAEGMGAGKGFGMVVVLGSGGVGPAEVGESEAKNAATPPNMNMPETATRRPMVSFHRRVEKAG